MRKKIIALIVITTIILSVFLLMWEKRLSSNKQKTTNLEEQVNGEINKSKINRNSKLEDITITNNKVNVYVFWGDGCPHCETELEFLEKILPQYEKYSNIYAFEVWYNEENYELMKRFEKELNDHDKGVPYTVIGNEKFRGFSPAMEDKITSSIIKQHKDGYDVYESILIKE